MDSAKTHLNNLFFDARRYDLSRFGRYKYNKKLALTPRIYNKTLARDVIDPRTGELLAARGETIDRPLGDRIAKSGVSVAISQVPS